MAPQLHGELVISEPSFSLPPMRARVDIPEIVDPKQGHTDVSFRYSPLVLKLNAAHPMYEQLLQLLIAAAASQSAVKYLYDLVDDTLLLAAAPGTQDLERTTIGKIAKIANEHPKPNDP